MIEIVVSDHALCRYAERIHGLKHKRKPTRAAEVRYLERKGFDKAAATRALRALAAPARCAIFRSGEEIYVYVPALTLVVKGSTVVTVLAPGMVYEAGWYERQRREGNDAMAAAFARATGVRIEGAIVRAFSPPTQEETS